MAEVTFYGAQWCGDCRRSESLLNTLGVDFDKKDFETSPEFTEEAIRVLKRSPLWIPGQNKGRFVASWSEIPIRLSTE